MSRDTLLKGVESLLGCERAVASGQVGAATHRDTASEQLKASPAPIQVDGDFCKRILVAVDELEPANWALQVGINFARLCGARLGLVHVIHGDMALTPEFAMARPDLAHDIRRAGEELLCEKKSLVPAELKVETILKNGDPSQQIVQTAGQWGADLIVLGTHGRAGIAHMLLGSTAESVVRRADCPVLTIGHDPAEKATRAAVDLTAAATPFSTEREHFHEMEPQTAN